MRNTLLVLIGAIGIAGCSQHTDNSQTPSQSANVSSSATTQPDNTAINARDQVPSAVTAGLAGQGQADVNIMADIRKQIMNGKMSVAAQNAKIICQAGKVTLRGPVNTQDEKDAIGNIANNVAGSSNVDNQIEVKLNT